MTIVEVTRDGATVATIKFKNLPMTQFGHVVFPLQGRMLTYECDPTGLLSDETIQEIGRDVVQKRLAGSAGEEGEYRWYSYASAEAGAI